MKRVQGFSTVGRGLTCLGCSCLGCIIRRRGAPGSWSVARCVDLAAAESFTERPCGR